MNKEYFFISGLPRSGSTLLSALLRQNPNFYADISTPLQSIIDQTIKIISNSEVDSVLTDENKKNFIKHIFDGYYASIDRPVVFDTNRSWTSVTPLLKFIFPYTKIICCVRELKWIINSFEKNYAKNVFFDKNHLVSPDDKLNVSSRCDSMMDPNGIGLVINPYIYLQEGIALNPDMILLVEYDELCQCPHKVMQKIYNFIDKPFYKHDFDNVQYSNAKFDESVGLKDLHTVKRKIEHKAQKFILPQFILDKFAAPEFWKTDNLKSNNSLNYD